MTPMPVPDASISKTNGREKFDRDNTGVVEMAVFNFSNASWATELHLKWPLVSKEVRGAAIEV